MARNLLLTLALAGTVGLVAGSVFASEHGASTPVGHGTPTSAPKTAAHAPSTSTTPKTRTSTKAAEKAPAKAEAAATYTPSEVRKRLVDGNVWFARGGIPVGDVSPPRREAIAPSQAPWCTVLTCADSRVPPEHLFNVGLGEMFTVRVAGNVADEVTTGSVEYAAEHLHTPVVLVLGHERCGAVKAALGTDKLGPNLDALLALIRPGIRGVTDLDQAIAANVRSQLATLEKSAILRQLEEHGKLAIIGGRYDLDSGVVTFDDGAGSVPTSPMSPVPFSH